MFFISETIIYMKKGFLITSVIIICTAISIVLSNLTSLVVHEAEADMKKYKETYADGKFYGIGDKLMGDAGEIFTKKENHVQILQDMNTWLHNNENFEYFEGRPDNVSYINPNVEGEFKDTYNDILKAYWLGPEDIEHFDIKVKEGRIFKDEDFIHRENLTNENGQKCEGELPIILGSLFCDRYNVGDTIEIYNMFFMGTARVVGILETNSKTVNSQGNIYVLDDSVILPFFTEFSGKESLRYLRTLFYQKNNGIMYSKLNAEDLQEMVNDYASYLGIAGGYFVFGAKNQWQAVFATNLDNMIDDIRKIAIGITSFSALAIAIYLFVKIKRSERYFGIMAINGFTKGQIRNLVISEVFMIVIGSVIIGIAGTMLVHDISYQEYDINYLRGLIPILVTGVIGLIIGLIGVERQELSNLISRKE